MESFTIKTIGCKVNAYESNVIKEKLVSLGFNYIDVEEKYKYVDLDYYIVNTCSVTSIADKKSRQMLHLAKKYNKNVKVIAIGCLVNSLRVENSKVNSAYDIFLDGVDYLISNEEKDKIVELIISLSKEKGTKNIENEKEKNKADIKESTKDVLAKPYSRARIRSFIKIQDGCDEYCTYCLIPYLRGHIRSRSETEILDEIKKCIENGVKEVVLTGIHLSSFGIDKVKLNDDNDKHLSYESIGAISIARENLISILNQISELKVSVNGEMRELERIRLGSLEPRIIDEKFLSAIAPKIVKNDITNDVTIEFNTALNSKFCASFCLSLQSGSDKTLKRMNRHYTTKDFENACNLIRKYIPYATITADVIVGFPGETDADYEESLAFVKKMRFYNPNIFPYSRRKGTKADEFSGQLSNNIKHERSVRMIKECEKISNEVENEVLSMKEKLFKKDANKILVEEIVEKDNIKYKVGYTKEYIKRMEQ